MQQNKRLALITCPQRSSLLHSLLLKITSTAMFNIMELDETVYSHLGLVSLVRCALISKRWNGAVTEFVWRTIPSEMWIYRWCCFRRLVLEVYLRYQDQQEQQQKRPLQERPLQDDRPSPAKKSRLLESSNTWSLSRFPSLSDLSAGWELSHNSCKD